MAEPKIKKIKSTVKMKEILADYFRELDEASRTGSKPIAWCTSVGPAELLHSLGFLVHYPENHGALLGATRESVEYIPKANAIGYSPDICSYLTSDVGACLAGKTPLRAAYNMEGVPKPSVLVYNTNQCRDVEDWFQYYARNWGVPIVGVHTPRGLTEVDEPLIDNIAGQIENLVEPLEKIAGTKFSAERFSEVVGLSRRTTDLWWEVLSCAAKVPSPITFFDGTVHMAPAVVLRGKSVANEYYETLLEELHDDIEHNKAAVEGEQIRLYWDGMPIWGKLRDLAMFFISQKTNVVASTYCNSWVFKAFDAADPFRSMARAYTELFICRSDYYKEDYITNLIKEFQCDGILFHDARTCPNNSNNRYGMPERMINDRGIPAVVIYGDLCDLRCYSEEQSRLSMEAFLEQIRQGK
ncbi:MAG: 2-hydroxyacyl-CoA dehydratase family protein [Desulfotomaculaceae bacterium]|nr:2-hydroxyacyl-CoA dehydratase family protein [Desulfotomaculaceae bacterium]